jgi:hypothetical protein
MVLSNLRFVLPVNCVVREKVGFISHRNPVNGIRQPLSFMLEPVVHSTITLYNCGDAMSTPRRRVSSHRCALTGSPARSPAAGPLHRKGSLEIGGEHMSVVALPAPESP